MTTRTATAIFVVLFATAAAHAQTELIIPAPSADSAEPTSIPDYCAERNVDCVIDDGTPGRVVVGAAEHDAPSVTLSAPAATAGSTVGGAATGGSLVR